MHGLRERAARREAAARLLRAAQGRDGAGNRLQFLSLRGGHVDAGDRAQQPLRVRVERLLEELAHRRLLHDLRAVHHDHALRGLGDDAHVVRDQHDGHAELGLELVQQLEDLRLDGHVEGGGGLVGDQEVRVARQRHGDHDALAHAAGELVRILLHAPLGVRDVHELEHLDRLVHRVAPPEALMQADGLRDLLAHREHGIQRGHRLLEDHRDLFATDLPHLRGGQAEEVLAVVDDLALHDASGRLRNEPHHAEGGDRLARARLADDAQRLALVDVEVDAVDGAHDALVGEEVRLESFDFEEPFGHGASRWRYQRLVSSRNASSAREVSSASTSLWVTQRMAAGPIAWTFTLRAAQPFTSSSVAAGPRSTRTMTMFVCTLARSTRRPGSFASPSPRRRAFAWSSASRSTMRSRATMPAAARMPTCRMPPPSILRQRRARSMKSPEPQMTEPTGAARPLDTQKGTESTWRVKSPAGRLSATAALENRAPSRCTGTPASWATAATAAISSGVQHVPP